MRSEIDAVVSVLSVAETLSAKSARNWKESPVFSRDSAIGGAKISILACTASFISWVVGGWRLVAGNEPATRRQAPIIGPDQQSDLSAARPRPVSYTAR